MKYWLALWGWAARWLAHIWVLKYLEENNIEIVEISWASMWSIVAVAYASGMSVSDLEKLAEELKIYKLLDFDIKTGLLKWKKIEKFLKEKLGDIDFEDLKIPVKVVATCLETWEKQVFKTGNVITAMRASMSLPWILSPLEIWDSHYIDGGVSCNLPVEVLHCENIIAVSALKDMSWEFKKKKKFLSFDIPKSVFSLNYDVIHRAVVIMMDQNETRSIHTPWKQLTYMRPDFWDLDYYSFDKVSEIIELWYTQAKKQLQI